MVRAQGGTEAAIVLGMRTQDFYAASGDRFPLDCGFVAQGYLMPCFSDAEVAAAHDRVALQQQARPRRCVVVRFGRRRYAYRHRCGCHDGLVVRTGRRLHRRAAQRAGLHRGARRPQGRRPGALPIHRAAYIGRPRRRRRHLRRADRHRARGAHRRTQTRRGRCGSGREGVGGRRAPPGGGHRTRHRVRRARRADGVRPPLRNLLAARRSRRPAVGYEQSRRGPRSSGRLRRDLLSEGPRPDRGVTARPQGPRACAGHGRRRSTTPPTTCRSSGRCSPTTARSTAPSSPAPRATA